MGCDRGTCPDTFPGRERQQGVDQGVDQEEKELVELLLLHTIITPSHRDDMAEAEIVMSLAVFTMTVTRYDKTHVQLCGVQPDQLQLPEAVLNTDVTKFGVPCFLQVYQDIDQKGTSLTRRSLYYFIRVNEGEWIHVPDALAQQLKVLRLSLLF